MKKSGILHIIEKNGYWLAVISRPNIPNIELDWLEITDDIQKYDGQPCSFTGKGNNVAIGNKIYYKPTIEQQIAQKAVIQKSISQIMRENANDDLIVNEDVPQKRQKFDDIFNLQQTKVPQDVRDMKFDENSTENFYLKLNKFARYFTDKEKFFFFKNDHNSNKRTGDKLEIREKYGKVNFDQICNREKDNALSILKDEQKNLCENKFKPQWRLVVGLGGASVYETGMTLHHIYGFPYIPASSIKGVLRSFIIQSVFYESLTPEQKNSERAGEEAEKAAMQCKDFCDIFGCDSKSYYGEARKGEVIFFDAFPLSAPTIEADIMTPHYGDYYSDKTNKVAPTDTQSPNPIPFLTIVDTDFQFLIGSKKFNIQGELWEDEGEKRTLNYWLKKALTEHGIGAKTAVGYGYMQPK